MMGMSLVEWPKPQFRGLTNTFPMRREIKL